MYGGKAEGKSPSITKVIVEILVLYIIFCLCLLCISVAINAAVFFCMYFDIRLRNIMI